MASQELPPAVASNRFPGKVAIVTGGASGKLARKESAVSSSFLHVVFAGIGFAIVERLAKENATVAIFDINQEAGERVVADLTAQELKVSYYKVDVADKEQCVQAAKAFAGTNSNQLHYLVNCAAYFIYRGLEATKEDWDKSLSVNVVGYANMVQACHPYLRETPGDKSIVNMASMSGHIAQPDYWTYNTTKGGILTLTKCMAMDVAKDGIRVNSISPALTWTPQIERFAAGDREKWEPMWRTFNMLGRICEASEVASAVCFLLSEDASYVTATDLRVDGGYGSLGPEGLGEKSLFAGTNY